MIKKVPLLLLSFSIVASSLFASNNFYQQGDTIFSFKTGASLPVAIDLYTDDETPFAGFDSGLSIGGIGAINFDYFYNETTSLGVEVGYDFNYSNSDTLYANIPIAVLLKYYPVQDGTWDVPLTLGGGISFNSYDDEVLLSLYTEAKAGFTYYVNENWGVGLEAGISFVPMFSYSSDDWYSNGYLAYSPVVVAVSYRK